MEGRRPRNWNSSSSSSSLSQSTRPRPQKPPSNLNQHAKISTFNRKFTPSTDSNTRKCTQKENVGEDAEGSSNFGSLVGTCPYMCPGKQFRLFKRERERERERAKKNRKDTCFLIYPVLLFMNLNS